MHENKKVKIVLSGEDIKQRGISLAGLESSLEIEDGKKKDAMKIFNDKIKELKHQISGVSREINDGFILIDIECEKEIDNVTGKVTFTRIDTGEVVEERPVTEEERQRPMFE